LNSPHNIITLFKKISNYVKRTISSNNITEHKGTIKEKHLDIETPGLVEDQGKIPHKWGNPFKLFFLLNCHKMFSKERFQ